MEKDTIKLLNEIMYYYKTFDWSELIITEKGFNLLVRYIEYLQRKVLDQDVSLIEKDISLIEKDILINEKDKYLRESE